MTPTAAIDVLRDVALARDLRDPQAILAAILDPKRRGSLYPYLHRLREVEPVLRTEQATGRPAWVLTRHADVREALKHPDVRSDERGVEVFDVGPEGRCFVEMQRNTLLFLPPGKHDRVRGLISRAFTPRAVSEREGRIRAVLEGLIDRVEPQGRMDLVHDFAFQLPVVVICEMLGVPTGDLPRFYAWAHDSSRRGEIGEVDAEIVRRGEEATRGYTDYFLELIEAHRREPRADLMTALIEARDEDGGHLSDEDLVGSCYILLQAGHGTTQDLLGMGTLALLRHPEQLELLRRAPAAIPTAVEEFLRYDTSVQISQRVADVPLELGGAKIPAGEVCVLLNGAANRDPAAFPAPDRLDVRRTPNLHVSFGLGRHTCLGASLARLELRSAFGTLLRRLPGLRLDESAPPSWRDSLFLRGLETLPVRF
ncbi:MAG TPA: cytochrome P450 [Myxococcota bacterium]|nr:cytochrome P450 [Myxococcota bacterium]